MNSMLAIALGILGSKWFAFIVIAPAVAGVVDYILKHNRGFKAELIKVMLKVQKLYPDWAGEDKKNEVVRIIKNTIPYAKFIPELTLHALIDGIVDEIKGAMEEK